MVTYSQPNTGYLEGGDPRNSHILYVEKCQHPLSYVRTTPCRIVKCQCHHIKNKRCSYHHVFQYQWFLPLINGPCTEYHRPHLHPHSICPLIFYFQGLLFCKLFPITRDYNFISLMKLKGLGFKGNFTLLKKRKDERTFGIDRVHLREKGNQFLKLIGQVFNCCL